MSHRHNPIICLGKKKKHFAIRDSVFPKETYDRIVEK